jgi:isopenicillin-N N-acyltransferase like protein
MGQQFGEACRQQIQELYHIRLKAALEHALERGRHFTPEQALQLIGSSVSILKNFDENIYQETLGIAQGSQLSIEQIFLLQGLTDCRDYLSWGKIPDGFGCTSMIIDKSRSKDGTLLLAQNWDLGTTNMPYVCFVIRHPEKAPSSYNLTVTGGLSLIGLNSAGLAIGTNNIKTTDTRPGVHYLNLIHKAMQLSTVGDVQKMIQNSTRSGAHYYLIGDKNGESCGLECSALNSSIRQPRNGIATHCNHILDKELSTLEAENMGDSTCHRQSRVDQLTAKGDFSIEDIKTILSDHDGGDFSICRHSDENGISTNASVIIEPQNGRIHACRSHPHSANWQTFTV